MEKYFFCNEIIETNIVIKHVPIFAPFRNNTSANEKYFSNNRIISTYCNNNSFAYSESDKPVYQSIQGLSVYLQDHTEIRVQRNFCSGQIETVFSDDGMKRVLQISDCNYDIDEFTFLNAIGLEKYLSERNKFILHASCIKTKEGAIPFTAPSGTGKSTQADLWNQFRGCEIMNGDRSGIWKEGNNWLAGGYRGVERPVS